jgi:hypothetical protein
VLAVLNDRVVCQRTKELHNFASKRNRAKGILQEKQKLSLLAMSVEYHHAEVMVSGSTCTSGILSCHMCVIVGCIRPDFIIFAYSLIV